MSLVKPNEDDVAFALRLSKKCGSRKQASNVMHVSQSVLRDIEVGRNVQLATIKAFRREKARLLAAEGAPDAEPNT
jgi:hypothetical protein